MKKLRFGKASMQSNTITSNCPIDSIFREVADRNIFILKDVFSKDKLLGLKEMVFEWSTTVDPINIPGENNHVILSGLSEGQKTAHAYHAYNFYWDKLVKNNPLHGAVRDIFTPMLEFQHKLTGNTDQSLTMHPQFIQYPCGGVC